MKATVPEIAFYAGTTVNDELVRAITSAIYKNCYLIYYFKIKNKLEAVATFLRRRENILDAERRRGHERKESKKTSFYFNDSQSEIRITMNMRTTVSEQRMRNFRNADRMRSGR